MDQKEWKGYLALAVVTAAAFAVIIGTRALTARTGTQQESSRETVEQAEVLNVEGYEGIRQGEYIASENGGAGSYRILAEAQGYGGPIFMEVLFDGMGSRVKGVSVLEHTETEGVGSKITETDFLAQFNDCKAPVTLPEQETPLPEEAVLQDGSYQAAGTEYDGYTDQLTMTVEQNHITGIVWDSLDQGGNSKRILADRGEYVMTETGLTWSEQADALAAAVIEKQSMEFLKVNEQGKTDAVAGVSISIGGFVSLVQDCMQQAAGIDQEALAGNAVSQETVIDAVTGATISSKAVTEAVNRAYQYVQDVMVTDTGKK